MKKLVIKNEHTENNKEIITIKIMFFFIIRSMSLNEISIYTLLKFTVFQALNHRKQRISFMTKDTYQYYIIRKYFFQSIKA